MCGSELVYYLHYTYVLARVGQKFLGAHWEVYSRGVVICLFLSYQTVTYLLTFSTSFLIHQDGFQKSKPSGHHICSP